MYTQLPTRQVITQRHLAALWSSLSDAVLAVEEGAVDSLVASTEDAAMLSSLAAEGRRLVQALEERVGPGHASAHPDAAPTVAVRKPRVLLVDDERDTLVAMAELLSDQFEISTTDNPIEAVALVQAQLPDAVVSDVMMPGLDGLALLKILQHAKSAAPPVLLVSGSADAAQRIRALELGAFDFLQKPVDIADLSARIFRATRFSTELRKQTELQQTDELTRLFNRRALRARLVTLLAEAHATQQPLSVALIDQDGLKRINDAWGHAAGDRSIVMVADALARGTREQDVVGRLGGDEFAVLMPATSTEAARRVLGQVETALAQSPVTVAPGQTRQLEVSWGVATLGPGEDGGDGAELLSRADDALYAMKRHKLIAQSL